MTIRGPAAVSVTAMNLSESGGVRSKPLHGEVMNLRTVRGSGLRSSREKRFETCSVSSAQKHNHAGPKDSQWSWRFDKN